MKRSCWAISLFLFAPFLFGAPSPRAKPSLIIDNLIVQEIEFDTEGTSSIRISAQGLWLYGKRGMQALVSESWQTPYYINWGKKQRSSFSLTSDNAQVFDGVHETFTLEKLLYFKEQK